MAGAEQTLQAQSATQTRLLDLPDELLLQILSHLPGGADTLSTVGATCRRLYTLSQQGVLWAQLFRDAGYKLTDDAARRVVATPTAPGTWHGREFDRHSETKSSLASLLNPATWAAYVSNIFWPEEEAKTPTLPADAIPVHFPTLFRARRFIAEEMQGKGPHRLFRPTPEDALPALETDKLVIPNHMWLMRESIKYYCACVHGSWAILGGRGGLVKIWYIPPLPIDGSLPEYGPSLALSFKVHEGSVVCLDFALEEAGDGLLVTGSRDVSAKVWAVDWGKPAPTEERTGVKLRLLSNLEGHSGPLAAVGITSTRIVTSASVPDGKMRVYDRAEVYTSESVNPLRVINIEIAVTSLAIHHDAEHLVTVGLQMRGCRLVNIETGDSIDAELKPRDPATSVVSVACQGETTIAGCFKAVTMYKRHQTRGYLTSDVKTEARSVLLSDPDHGITAGYDGRIHFWDLKTGTETRTYEIQGTGIFAIARDGMHLVAGLGDGTVVIITYGVGMPYLGLFA